MTMKISNRCVKVLKQLILLSLCISTFLGIWLLRKVDTGDMQARLYGNISHNYAPKQSNNILPVFIRQKLIRANLTKQANNSYKTHLMHSDLEPLEKMSDTRTELRLDLFNVAARDYPPCYKVHAFYYPWYGNPEHDGQYIHWNHPFLPHWNKNEAKKWRQDRHIPPDDVGANYFPFLGPYSSKDPDVVDKHMQMMRFSRIGVIVVSWYPAGEADNEGLEPDALMPLILYSAHKYELKVAIHVEPFKKIGAKTMRTQLQYIFDKYGKHPAFYRTNHADKSDLPLIYIYDSYLVNEREWEQILSKSGSLTIRGTELDAIVIGLLVEGKHQNHILKSGFDGFYSYFATNGFTFGSTWGNWRRIRDWAASNNLLFIPSAGPGYVDTEVRPWNGANRRKRLGGKYYQESFTNAVQVKPDYISITSFNEWHEGTQIEPAVAKKTESREYQDYGSHGPFFYLNTTRELVGKFSCDVKL